jgi:ketol-acid reductoisomerase
MKINITVDITPEELRKSFGLPDFNSFNENIMKKMTEKVQSGKFDAEDFFKTINPASNPLGKMFMNAAMKNMEMMAKKSEKKSSSKKDSNN